MTTALTLTLSYPDKTSITLSSVDDDMHVRVFRNKNVLLDTRQPTQAGCHEAIETQAYKGLCEEHSKSLRKPSWLTPQYVTAFHCLQQAFNLHGVSQ